MKKNNLKICIWNFVLILLIGCISPKSSTTNCSNYIHYPYLGIEVSPLSFPYTEKFYYQGFPAKIFVKDCKGNAGVKVYSDISFEHILISGRFKSSSQICKRAILKRFLHTSTEIEIDTTFVEIDTVTGIGVMYYDFDNETNKDAPSKRHKNSGPFIEEKIDTVMYTVPVLQGKWKFKNYTPIYDIYNIDVLKCKENH